MTNKECMREIHKAVVDGLIPVEVGMRAYKAMDRDNVVEPAYEKIKNRKFGMYQTCGNCGDVITVNMAMVKVERYCRLCGQKLREDKDERTE